MTRAIRIPALTATEAEMLREALTDLAAKPTKLCMSADGIHPRMYRANVLALRDAIARSAEQADKARRKWPGRRSETVR